MLGLRIRPTAAAGCRRWQSPSESRRSESARVTPPAAGRNPPSIGTDPGRAFKASTHWSDLDNWPAARGLPSPAAPRAQIPAEGLSPGGPPADNTSFTLCIRVSNTSFTLYIRVASRTEKSSDRAAGRAAHGNRNNGREWG